MPGIDIIRKLNTLVRESPNPKTQDLVLPSSNSHWANTIFDMNYLSRLNLLCDAKGLPLWFDWRIVLDARLPEHHLVRYAVEMQYEDTIT